MGEETNKQTVGRRLPDRREELWAQIDKLAERVVHMEAQARLVEVGERDEKERFDGQEKLLYREETLKFQPSAAVGYWKELREQEVRLDGLREKLRDLEEMGCGSTLNVVIHWDGPPVQVA